MTEGKQIQDFIKEQKKTARERFEEAGWKIESHDDYGCFSFDKANGNEFVTFDTAKKTFWVGNCQEIDMETHKLITYQLEELGWL